MTGRVMVCDRVPVREAVNEFGVPYRELYRLARENHERVLAAHRRALEAWQQFHAAYEAGHVHKADSLSALARELTERALS